MRKLKDNGRGAVGGGQVEASLAVHKPVPISKKERIEKSILSLVGTTNHE